MQHFKHHTHTSNGRLHKTRLDIAYNLIQTTYTEDLYDNIDKLAILWKKTQVLRISFTTRNKKNNISKQK